MKYEMYRNSVQEKSHREVVLFLYENLKKGKEDMSRGRYSRAPPIKRNL